MHAPKHLQRPSRLLAAVTAAAILVFVAGCSSSSDDGSSPTTTVTTEATTSSAAAPEALSADEWREQANAICAETAPTIGEAFEAMDPAAPTPEQVDHVVSTLVSVNRDTQERIDALAEPPALADQVDALLSANEDATATIEDQGAAALDTLDQIFATPNELATDLGLTACAG